jgi:hypothetical protein
LNFERPALSATPPGKPGKFTGFGYWRIVVRVAWVPRGSDAINEIPQFFDRSVFILCEKVSLTSISIDEFRMLDQFPLRHGEFAVRGRLLGFSAGPRKHASALCADRAVADDLINRGFVFAYRAALNSGKALPKPLNFQFQIVNRSHTSSSGRCLQNLRSLAEVRALGN